MEGPTATDKGRGAEERLAGPSAGRRTHVTTTQEGVTGKVASEDGYEFIATKARLKEKQKQNEELGAPVTWPEHRVEPCPRRGGVRILPVS